MLIGQASINLTANVLSALLGLASVFVFTRLFSPHDYGVYLLGVGFASVVSVVLVSWFRNVILSGHARDDGPDFRGVVISGHLILCLTAPLAYGAARLVGLGVWIPGLEARTRLPTIERPIGYRDFKYYEVPQRSPGRFRSLHAKVSVRQSGRSCRASVRRMLSGRRIQTSSGRLPSSNPTDLATGTFGRSTMVRSITGLTARGSIPR
jgi:hypothetical protein